MARRCLCAVLVFCMAALTYSVSAQVNSNAQMVISIKVCETAGEGSKQKTLAEPTIATIPGRPFSFESGGSVRTKTRDGDLDIGTRVTGTFERTRTGTVQLALKISFGVPVPQDDDPKTDLVKTETLDIRTALRPSETKRLKCSASQWCEVRVDPVE
jgi:hypothetical protein